MIETVTKAPVTIIATRPSIATGVAYNPLLQQLAQSSKVNKLLMGGGTLSEERSKLLVYSWNAECYDCLGKKNGWYKIKVDGKIGYVRADLMNWDGMCTF